LALKSRAAEAVRPLLEARTHTLSLSLPGEPISLEADAARLEQVIVNLLNNAAKYTEPGGAILLAAERAGSEAVVRVRDTGRGIPAKMLPHVFNLFTQVSPELDRPLGGLGLGLTLVRKLVTLHGGSVSAHSAGPGRGCEFVVRLPALEGGASQRPTPARPRPVAAPAPLHVLIVDDNVDAAESLADMIQLWGHTTRIAFDGWSGIEAAQTCLPDVVLLDIGLPGIDGFEVARRLRIQLEGDLPYVVALTGYGQEEDRRRTREAGFDEHLVKPVNPPELELLLTGLPRQGRTRRDRSE
jgi:CheY-like chemotaxis protein/anti-sigma regulatory factor (Ser/Thr protein kinase)